MEEIGLFLPSSQSAPQLGAAAGAVLDSRIMSCCHKVDALVACVFPEVAKLYCFIAYHAGIGRKTPAIGIHKRLNHPLVENVAKVERQKGDIQMPCDL